MSKRFHSDLSTTLRHASARQRSLLRMVVKSYIESAGPVGSAALKNRFDLGMSSATIRNEMMELEKVGFIVQPHTSAGRVPTALGYRYYLDNLLDVKAVNEKEHTELASTYDEDLRDLAKLLVDKTDLAIIVGQAPNDLYFTGLFNLFSQPEFEDLQLVLSMSQVVDSLEKAMADIYHKIKEPTILLGEENPFSEYCSVAITFLPSGQLLAIVGPLRMDYNKALGLLEEITDNYNK